VNVFDLEWTFLSEDVLELAFSLPAGSYATAVLREVVRYGE
jgi:tRNA pseudouridine13 synthase